jgi:WhiB family redox-sensing transcriptional regulator
VIGDPIVDDPSWWDFAACANSHPDLFFPERGQATVTAKRICASCPVREECLEHALTNGEYWGVWGGKSELERKRLRRTRRAA